jgi:hypothetical protein
MIPIGTAVPLRYPPIITWLLIATDCAVEKPEALAEKLSTGTWTHDFPLFAQPQRSLACR